MKVRGLRFAYRWLGLLLLVGAGAGTGWGQTVTKTTTSQISQTAADWSATPTAESIGEFGASTQAALTLSGPVTLAGLSFTAAVPADVTVTAAGGATLTLGASGIVLAATGKNVLLSHGVVLAAAQAWNVGTGRILEVSGVLSDAGGAGSPFGLTKSGAGRLILSGSTSNTFTGLTTITGGVLFLNKSGGATAIAGNISASGNPANIELGADEQIADTSVVTLNGGAKLQLNGYDETIGGLATPGSGLSLVQATEAGSNLLSTLTVANAADHVFDGILRNSASGTGNELSLVKTGVGTLTVLHSGTHASGLNFTGSTTVQQGVLELRATGNGKTMTTWRSVITVEAAGTLLLNHVESSTTPASTAETLSRVIQGSGQVIKRGTGRVDLTGVNSYSGVTTLETGTLNVATLSNYGVNGALGNRAAGADGVGSVGLLFTGGTLQYTGATAQSTDRAIRLSTAGAFIDASGSTLAGTMSFTGTASPDLLLGTGARTLTLTGSHAGNNAFNLPLYDQDVTTGRTGLTKLGAGTWRITNTDSSYSGVTTLQGGILNVASLADYGVNSSLGNRALSMEVGGNMGLLFRGGTLQYTGSTAQSTNRGIRISTTGGAFIDASGSSPAATLSFTATAAVDLYESAGSRQLTLTGTNTGNNTFSIRLTDQAVGLGNVTSLNKTGTGTWILSVPSATANAYTGPTTISAGILAVQGGGAISDAGRVVLADVAGAVFQLNAAETIGSLAGGGSTGGEVNVQGFALTMNGTVSGESFAGRIRSNTATNVSHVIKAGTGIQYLTGTDSTYSGFTEINAGILNFASIGNLGENSSLGNRAADAATGQVGLIFRGGTLQYTGSTAQTTNRAIRIAVVSGATGGGTIDASGSTPTATLNFTATSSPDLYVSAGARYLTLTGSNAGNNTFNIRLTDQNASTGKTTFNKEGTGTWRLSGTHTYTGPTNVNAGTLLVTGSLANTEVTVAALATLGGTGTITGALTVNGRLAPGGDALLTSNGIGVLKTGAATFAATSTGNVFGLAGNGYASSVMNSDGTVNAAFVAVKTNRSTGTNDRLEVTGNLDLGTADGVKLTLELVDGYVPQYGHAFDILDWTTLSALTNFNYGGTGRTGGETENASYDLLLPALTGTGWVYNLDYFSTQGVIIVVPEPGRGALLLLGGLLVVARRRRVRVG